MSIWRTAAAVLILAVLAILAARLLPIYLRNHQLQSYVAEIAGRPENQGKPPDLLRVSVLQKAAALGLPVKAGNVDVKQAGDRVRINVRYIVRVDLPLYTVDLHFYPGAGSR